MNYIKLYSKLQANLVRTIKRELEIYRSIMLFWFTRRKMNPRWIDVKKKKIMDLLEPIGKEMNKEIDRIGGGKYTVEVGRDAH